MPGLFGYWMDSDAPVPYDVLGCMAGSMRHQPKLRVETAVHPGFGGGRVHLGLFQPAPQPCTDPTSRYLLWLDGEFNNAAELAEDFGIAQAIWSDHARLTLALYQRDDWGFLRDVDGLFAIALFDKMTRRLTLVSDRYGLRPLYWRRTSRGLAYAGEVKALLELLGAGYKLDTQAVDEWFSFGYLLGNRTWIEGVELLPPGTVMQISDEGITRTRYWSWQDLASLPASTAEEDIVEEMGDLWIDAVDRRVDQHRIGIFLSGGLDSRSVLAAMPARVQSLHAITFGKDGCDDITIAKCAAQVRGIPHHIFGITADNFLLPRVDAVWRTDGLFNLLDMHGLEFMPLCAPIVEIELQSLNDIILRGSYLQSAFVECWKHSFPCVFRKMYLPSTFVEEGRAKELLEQVFVDYAVLSHSDFLFLDNRVRRFTYGATIGAQSFFEARFPSLDSHLMEFVYGLDDRWRLDRRIYHQMLLQRFPLYYETIPWQKTGLPISAPVWRHKRKEMVSSANRTVRSMARRLGWILPPGRRNYTDYSSWLRAEPARGFITELLLGRRALYPDYVQRDCAQRAVEALMDGSGQQYTYIVGLLLTFEIYLRQLFDYGESG